jgi:hypothetical protein
MDGRLQQNLNRLETSAPEIHAWLQQRNVLSDSIAALAEHRETPTVDRDGLRSTTLLWFGADRRLLELVDTLDGEVNLIVVEPRPETLVAFLAELQSERFFDAASVQIIGTRRHLAALDWSTFALASVVPVNLEVLGETPLTIAVLRHLKRHLEEVAAQQAQTDLTYLVMLTYNRLRMTRLALSRLVLNTTRPFRLLVVDNGSTDGTKEWLASAGLSFLERVFAMRENLGIGRALNNALLYARSRSRHIGRLDNDVLVPPFWLQDLQTVLRSSLAPRVVSGFVTDDENIRIFIDRGSKTMVDDLRVFLVDCVGGACNLYHPDTFIDLGYLPEVPLYGIEDGGLAKAVRQAGETIAIVDNVKVEHLSTLLAALGDDQKAYDAYKSGQIERFARDKK